MDDKKIDLLKIEIMASTVRPILDLLNKRMKARVDMLNTLSSATLDNIPDSVKLKREEEASKLRAVIQEQADLIAMIQSLYPVG